MDFPRIIIAALRGGSGKTILSVGIIATWIKLGKSIAPYKKGPDYIDTGWLALAAGRPCYNLDTFLIPPEKVIQSFITHTLKDDIAVIEGNRGLYDGIDRSGSTSTAELAKLIAAPVVLCIDCTKSTRTMAAVVSGCIQFDPDVNIKGVVLNRVAGPRHVKIIKDSIEHHCSIPVLGAIPKLSSQNFPERHMGLVPTPEHEWAKDSILAAAQIAEKYLDITALNEIAFGAPFLRLGGRWQGTEVRDQGSEVRGQETEDRTINLQSEIRNPKSEIERYDIEYTGADLSHQAFQNDYNYLKPNIKPNIKTGIKPRIGILKDSAFQFYYPENIEALMLAGAKTVFVSPLKDKSLPPLDALYIGGGFPETHVKKLAENNRFRDEIKSMAKDGLPIYAECGGLIYLGEELVIDGKPYPMAGVLPLAYDFSKKPQGHGYTILIVEGKNPYFEVGTEITGHEFHYSRVIKWGGDDMNLVFSMKRGKGLRKNRDGVCYKNVLATYTHIHALGTPAWAEAMVRNAAAYKK